MADRKSRSQTKSENKKTGERLLRQSIQGGQRDPQSIATGVRQNMVHPGGPLSQGGAAGGAGGQPEDVRRNGGMIGEG